LGLLTGQVQAVFVSCSQKITDGEQNILGNNLSSFLLDALHSNIKGETIMFLKILAASVVSIGLATSAMAQASGTSGSGSTSGSSTGGATNNNGSSNGTNGNGSDSTGSTSSGGGSASTTDGGKASDCNALATGKNTTATKSDQVNNPAATSTCP
jgi:hypothetical protein